MIVGGVLLISFSANKNVILSIDGKSQTIYTSAWTVGGLIRSARIPLYPGDWLSRSPTHWLLDGEQIVIKRSANVRIEADGEVVLLRSIERLPGNLLAQAGVPLYPGDQLVVNGRLTPPDSSLPPSPAFSIQVQREKLVSLSTNDQVHQFTTHAVSLGEALWDRGIAIHPNDHLSPPANTTTTSDLRASLQESRLIEIEYSGRIMSTRSTAETVGEILSQAGIPLQGLDYSLPIDSAPVPTDRRIRVVHVQENTIMETEPLAFPTEIQPAADLELDQQDVIQAGVYGLKAKRIRIRLEDGQEVSRQIEEEYVALEPEPEIIGFGTKIVPRTLDAPGGPIQYWRALNMYAVSYNPTSAGDSTTATGATLQKGIAAIDPSIIPYGTQMYIPGYGRAVAADTGGGVKGRLIDLGYSDDDYVSWHQWVTVYFLWPPPENVVWVIP
jgi:uncharacterized protein YabE (DUF348 family)